MNPTPKLLTMLSVWGHDADTETKFLLKVCMYFSWLLTTLVILYYKDQWKLLSLVLVFLLFQDQ